MGNTHYITYKKVLNRAIGPGGINCRCCGLKPGEKVTYRSIKRKIKGIMNKELIKFRATGEYNG